MQGEISVSHSAEIQYGPILFLLKLYNKSRVSVLIQIAK